MNDDMMLAKSELARRIAEISTLEGEFTLRSGQIANRYFDKYRFEGEPSLLKPLARVMADLIPEGTEMLAGLELGGVPLATAISLETGLPAAFIRKKAKTYGTCRAIEGQDFTNRRITFIEDVITTGGAVADAHRLALEGKASVLGVVCAIWRGDGAPAISGLPALPVLPAFMRAELEAEESPATP